MPSQAVSDGKVATSKEGARSCEVTRTGTGTDALARAVCRVISSGPRNVDLQCERLGRQRHGLLLDCSCGDALCRWRWSAERAVRCARQREPNALGLLRSVSRCRVQGQRHAPSAASMPAPGRQKFALRNANFCDGCALPHPAQLAPCHLVMRSKPVPCRQVVIRAASCQ